MDFSGTDKWKSLAGKRIATIDSHTAGESTRLIISGMESIRGKTMTEKLFYYKENLDDIRLLLTREPRGHRGILAAQLTEPVTEGAAFGLIYMDARRYPYLCGHGTIGAVTTLVETGALNLEPPESTVIVDTPSGPLTTRVGIRNGKVRNVSIKMTPSFVFETNRPLNVSSFGKIHVDLVCVGGFFALVSADKIGLELSIDNTDKLVELGMDIIQAANEQLIVHHPDRPEVKTVDVTEFYDGDGSHGKKGKSVVIYGESHIDRSPCGTGTSAKLTLLHHQGKIAEFEPFINSGPLETTFEARIVNTTRVGNLPAVEVEITSSAHITGFHEFVVDTDDPLPKGFLL